jgi:hypothetical protein
LSSSYQNALNFPAVFTHGKKFCSTVIGVARAMNSQLSKRCARREFTRPHSPQKQGFVMTSSNRLRIWALRPLLLLVGLSLPAWAATADSGDAETFAAVKSAFEAKSVQQSNSIGNAGKTAFSEAPAKPGVLIGFDLGVGKLFSGEGIYAVRPIYLTAEGERVGPDHGLFQANAKTKGRSKVLRVVTVKANPGYAVGAITGRAGGSLNGMSVTFMRLDGDKLNPADSYQSEWVGDRKGGNESMIGSDGALVVGIFGKGNDVDCQSLGLLHLPSATPAAVNVQAVAAPAAAKAEAPKAQQPAQLKPVGAKAEPEAATGSWIFPALIGMVVIFLGFGGACWFTMMKKQPAVDEAEAASAVQPGAINLPEALEAKIRQELTPGEEIVWAGQQSPRVVQMKVFGTVAGCAFGALFAAGMLLFTLSVKNGPPVAFQIVPGLLVAVFLAGTVLAPRTTRRMAAETAYIITNRRAIVHKPAIYGFGSVNSYGPMQLQGMVRRDWFMIKGIGDLIFHSERRLEVSSYNNGRNSGTSVRERITHFGFLGIDNVAAVENILRQALINRLVDKWQA